MADFCTIGLTGPTGAGKSEVANIMCARAGWTVIDADKISRKVVEVGSPTLAALVERFSADILCADGSLDRKRLAAIAFATPEQTGALNAIVHPAVIREIRKQRREAANRGFRFVVIDAPLLIQAGVDVLCDCTVAVVATPEKRLERICLRDSISEEQARLRMNAQWSDEEFADQVTYALYNLGDREQLYIAAQELCDKIEGAAL